MSCLDNNFTFPQGTLCLSTFTSNTIHTFILIVYRTTTIPSSSVVPWNYSLTFSRLRYLFYTKQTFSSFALDANCFLVCTMIYALYKRRSVVNCWHNRELYDSLSSVETQEQWARVIDCSMKLKNNLCATPRLSALPR